MTPSVQRRLRFVGGTNTSARAHLENPAQARGRCSTRGPPRAPKACASRRCTPRTSPAPTLTRQAARCLGGPALAISTGPHICASRHMHSTCSKWLAAFVQRYRLCRVTRYDSDRAAVQSGPESRGCSRSCSRLHARAETAMPSRCQLRCGQGGPCAQLRKGMGCPEDRAQARKYLKHEALRGLFVAVVMENRIKSYLKTRLVSLLLADSCHWF